MNQKDTLEVFEKAPVSKAVFKNAIPAMCAMLMVLLYNIADIFFIGQTHNDFQVASVSLASPVFLFFIAIGTVFGIGGTSVISRSLGKGDKDYAKKVSAFCFYGVLICGILFSAIILIFLNPILKIIGASSETWEYTKTYLTIVTLSGPFFALSNCFGNVIRAEGKSGIAMAGQVIGNLINIILDPIMILVLKMEIKGAAIATVIGNCSGAVFYLIYLLLSKKYTLSTSFKDFTLKDKVLKNVFAIGVPAALGSFLVSMSHIIVNSQMAKYGDFALAGIGVSMKVTMITSMIFIGFGQGVQPLLGFCIGAKNFPRYRKCLRFSLICAFCLSLILTSLCYIFTHQIVEIFLTDPISIEYGIKFSRILLTTSVLFGMFYILLNSLQAQGAAIASFIVNISRQGLVYIPVMFILGAIFQEIGLVWAQPVADILSMILVIVLYLNNLRKIKKKYY